MDEQQSVFLFIRYKMTTSTTTPKTIYKGFNIQANCDVEKNNLEKTVDDFEIEVKNLIMQVDAARIALSNMGACNMLEPKTFEQRQLLKGIALGTNIGPVTYALAPNRIESKHFTRSSRVRNLVHGGVLGLLASRLMNDTSQIERQSRTHNSLSVIRRVNCQTGCERVRWARIDIGVKIFKRGKGPFEALDCDDAIVEFKLLNTVENQQTFIEELKSAAMAMAMGMGNPTNLCDRGDDDGSKWVTNPHASALLDNLWFSKYISCFIQICSFKMSAVSNNELSKITRASNLVELYRFISGNIDWILTDHNMRIITGLNRFWEKYIERLVFMTQEGIEHAACMLMLYFPEMMTPELHVDVNPVTDLYRVPQMQIADDDEMFGPLKAKCLALLPEATEVVVVTPVGRNYYSSDDEYDEYDEYDRDYEDEEEEEEEEDRG